MYTMHMASLYEHIPMNWLVKWMCISRWMMSDVSHKVYL